MKMPIKLLLLATLIYSGALLADTDGAAASTQSPAPAALSLPQACPAPVGQRLATAQVSQADCCKGHKGICGCRAGKIVCCDNTISPTCTCHSDWDIAN
ncbi:MAG: hypothetical protein COW48_00770 [Hydrogenophilales bacterium CG17_big_fil_post_rev_8_21_14_2_50_63_12]|nr:MAG: hypothetical protein COW48_00770 [Hydrogenophilales bacterium CG17_big_fil_post_rev_8_21_14_2_50_63_12]PIX96544.1 MAG: hypothetical protein COZ24_09865 [Hydrogenophilales bacterium CG_4_10_14_3_um_filter_63_21]PJB05810.1 MAG: hypothetical protein CO126_02950 [Hydrogenophilales bacterium CG_4_9_14_3_um_filter_63_34]